MSFAFIPIYINYLGIEAYGLIGIYALLQTWLGLLDMGMTPTLSREMARFMGGGHDAVSIRDLLRTIEGIAGFAAICMVWGVWAASGWLASDWLQAGNLSTDAVAKAFSIMGLVAGLRFFSNIYGNAIIGLQRQVLSNFWNAIFATVRGVGAVGILVWVSPTIEAFFLWQAVVSIMTLLSLAGLTYRLLPCGERGGRFSWLALRSVWRFAGGIMTQLLLTLLLTHVDKILLSRMLTLSEYGRYTLAATAAGALYMLITPIVIAWYPKLTELYTKDDQNGLIAIFHKGAQLVTVIASSAALVVMLFAQTLLQLWTRDLELATAVAPLLSVMIFGNLIKGFMWMPYHTQLAHGWTGLAIRVDSVAVLLVIPAILWVVPRWGALGAAWIGVSLNIACMIVTAQIMYRRILVKEKWSWLINDILMPLLVAFLAAITTRAVFGQPEGIFEQLAVLIFAASFTLTAAILAGDITRKQIQMLMSRSFL